MALKGKTGTLTTAASLANLLPTGTVLTFQALIPSFSQNGKCELANKVLTLSVIIVCSIACFLSSFTDSFTHKGKLYHGIAWFKKFYIFNKDKDDDFDPNSEEFEIYHINFIDFVHAFASLIVFLVFAITSSDVQSCFIAKMGRNEEQLMINLPLGAGLLSTFLFMLFPTKRRGIGYTDTASNQKPDTASNQKPDTASNQEPENKTKTEGTNGSNV